MNLICDMFVCDMNVMPMKTKYECHDINFAILLIDETMHHYFRFEIVSSNILKKKPFAVVLDIK